MQVQSNTKFYSYKNSFDAVKTICKTEGITTLYKAYPATLMYFGMWSGLNFSFY